MSETKERKAYRKDNDMNEFDKRAEAYMRTVMNNDGDVFTRADLYECIMDAWKAGYAETGFDLSLLSGESLSKAQDIILKPRPHTLSDYFAILNELAHNGFCGTIFHHPTEEVIVQVKLKDNNNAQNHD